MMVRRRIAAGVGVVALIVIVLLINGCLKSGKEAALKTYNREAGQVVQESDQQVSSPLFKALAGASGESPLNVEVQVNQLRMQAQSQAARAKGLSVPGEMQDAQRNFTLVLDLREEALAKIAHLRAHGAGRAGQAGEHLDRRGDGDVPGLRRGLLPARRPADPAGARWRTESTD